MSEIIEAAPAPAARDAVTAPPDVRADMRPVYVGGCFGMLHPAAGRHAVLICGSLGDEALNSYRALVFLAAQLAGRGFPTLRLEYPGAGDSAGEDAAATRYDEWLDGIRAGVAWLRETCDAEHVTLIGLRVGAALATEAASSLGAVESLVLLAPCASGARFLHEQSLAAQISGKFRGAGRGDADGGWFEAHGLRLHPLTRAALGRLDVARLRTRPSQRALVLEGAARPATRAALEQLAALGTGVTHRIFDGLDRMLRESHESEIPHDAFACIAAWVGDQAPAATRCAAVAPARLDTGAAWETPIRFGPDGALFGILCEPKRHTDRALPMLIVNTSANPRFGNSRLGVMLARQLAEQGVATLRMDGRGVGDALPWTGDRGTPYSPAATEDVLHAVEELALRIGEPVLVLGMCSGAYHAFQAAQRDARISGLILTNPVKLGWQDGDTIAASRRRLLRPLSFRTLADTAEWRRLVRGEIDVGRVALALARRIVRRLAAAIDPAVTALRGGETTIGRVRRQVRQLGAHGVRMLCAFSSNDAALAEATEYFGADAWRLRRQPHVTVRVLDHADHTLSAASMRQGLLDAIHQFLLSDFEHGQAPSPR